MGWYIKPCLQYIKKSGAFGRLEKFKPENMPDNISPEDLALVNKLIAFGEEDSLRYYIKSLKETASPVFIENTGSPVEEVFKKIKKIEINFNIYSASKTLSNVDYIQLFTITDDTGEIHKTTAVSEIPRDAFNLWIICKDNVIYYRENDRKMYLFFKMFIKERHHLNITEIKMFKEMLTKYDIPDIKINIPNDSILLSNPVPKVILELSDYLPNRTKYEIKFDYKYHIVSQYDDYHYITHQDGSEIKLIERNSDYEKIVLAYLQNELSKYTSTDFHLFLIKYNLWEFILKAGKDFIDKGIEIRVDNKIISGTGKAQVRFHVESGIDWFSITPKIIAENEESIDIDLKNMEISNQLLKAGNMFYILTQEDIEKLKLLRQDGINNDNKINVSKYNFNLINELFDEIENNNDPEIQKSREIIDKLSDFKSIKQISSPENLKGKLRDYQYAGYIWLNFLKEYDLNGILADDMGLGKTIQTLALLLKMKEEKKKFTALILAPVSTILNWENEINKFTPDLTYLIYHGKDRGETINNWTDHDIIISSYHTVRNDIERISGFQFDYIILDESQSIKNSATKIFKAIKMLKSTRRLTLTGTPIENNTLELWSQMEFLNPNFLGSITHFKSQFTKPIEGHNDKNTLEKLRKKIFPFILRRKKEDVLKELPEKTEIIQYSEMEKGQAKLYDDLRRLYKEEISKSIEKSGVEKSAMQILTALLRLRQVSLFPGLIDKKYENIGSCKYEQFQELLDEILSEEHKVVIFSQFVEVLNYLKNHLDNNKIKYSYFDGSTEIKKRQKQIDDFQKRHDLKVIMISLKSGGFGINLTAADYVIIFDPWWNPAVETQAIDRTHRIGQTKKVFAYKLIVKGTVEEKILELQKKKKKLADEIISIDSGLFKKITKEEILNLFS